MFLDPKLLEGSYNYKCDLWSTGIIVYMLLAGEPPYYSQHCDEPLPFLLRFWFTGWLVVSLWMLATCFCLSEFLPRVANLMFAAFTSSWGVATCSYFLLLCRKAFAVLQLHRTLSAQASVASEVTHTGTAGFCQKNR